MENLLKYLFPSKCLFCGSLGDIFCDSCLSECTLLKEQYCIVCDNPSDEGFTHEGCYKDKHTPARVVCVYSYSGKVRECIKFSKYGARQFLSLRKLCFEAAEICAETWAAFNVDLCLPVPSSPKKLSSRGFNQANMVAEEVSKRFGLNLRKDVLLRVRSTEAQHTKRKDARRENVKGAFFVKDPVEVKGRRILLVDDICTTGATFVESASALHASGATEVCCFALSKTERFRKNTRLL